MASLQSLEDAHGPYTAVIAAAGAAAGVLPEIGALLPSLVLMTLTVRFQDSVGHQRGADSANPQTKPVSQMPNLAG